MHIYIPIFSHRTFVSDCVHVRYFVDRVMLSILDSQVCVRFIKDQRNSRMFLETTILGFSKNEVI